MKVVKPQKSINFPLVLLGILDFSDEQKELLTPISEIKDKEGAEVYLSQLRSFIIPFKKVSPTSLERLFPKAKKLKIPNLDSLEWEKFSYLGLDDIGAQRKYLIVYEDQKLIGIPGSFKPIHTKGICMLCNKHGEIGLFRLK